jgi:hypothetical protein
VSPINEIKIRYAINKKNTLKYNGTSKIFEKFLKR